MINRFATLFLSNTFVKDLLVFTFRFFIKILIDLHKACFYFLVDRGFFSQKSKISKTKKDIFIVFYRDCGPKHTQVEIQTGLNRYLKETKFLPQTQIF